MKRTARILIVCATLMLAGCGEPFDFNNYDRTNAAYVVFGEVDRMLDDLVETTTHAFVLSSYMDASTDSERQRIEDTYYYYYKIRNEVDGRWAVVGNNYREEYYVADEKSLSEEGGSWLVEVSPNFRGNRFDYSEIMICRTSLGQYKMVLNQAKTGLLSGYYDDLLETGTTAANTRYTVSGELDLSTDYFSSNGQDIDRSMFSLNGSLKMVDTNNPNYSLEITISEPIRSSVGLRDLQAVIQRGKYTVAIDETISGAKETVAVEYLNANKILLKYTTAEGIFDNIYHPNYYSYYY